MAIGENLALASPTRVSGPSPATPASHPRMSVPSPSPLSSPAHKTSRLRQANVVAHAANVHTVTDSPKLVHEAPAVARVRPTSFFLRGNRACYCTHIARDNCRDYGVHNNKAHGPCAVQAGQHCYTAGAIATPTTATDTKDILAQGQVQPASHSLVQHRAICMTF